MRYIGNKTRLLPFLERTLRRLEIETGSAHDAFAGTASVGRALKASGWRVASSDIMTYSYVFQRAYVVAQRSPSFAALRRAVESRGGGSLNAVAEYLSRWLEPTRDFVTAHFAPSGGRMYFAEEN